MKSFPLCFINIDIFRTSLYNYIIVITGVCAGRTANPPTRRALSHVSFGSRSIVIMNARMSFETWAALFNGQSIIAEAPTSLSEPPTETDAAKFLVYMGFDDCVPEVMFALSRLLSEAVCRGKYCIKDTVLEIAGSKPRSNALLNSISYYLDKNYDNVRKTALCRYGTELPKINDGTKSFINRMSIIYSVYYLPEMADKRSKPL